ncbi:MAG TPA: AAA-associated domain-containing protein, partial [Streptosporangiaceae bacterium]|nr:AAA-associated domain-containing protein [Streptosporangiaceae bacterium]
SRDDTLPAGFFTDILRTSYGEEEAARQLDVAVNWGRYAELYDYDATRGEIIREEQGIGATIADAPRPAARGSLTVYLGPAPGAGTTYTMLREGQALRAQGEDVVIGFADTHGRPHTVEALGGLETVPPRATGSRAEPGDAGLDVAAVLERRPAVALVDDLGGHAAAIETLRVAGIHVISTAEVADVASAADEVEAITGNPAPATVSDETLAAVDALQFVDSSPEALRKRLGHGNIYPPEQIETALRTEFQPARLAALREIGLRLVAQWSAAQGATAPGAPVSDAARSWARDVLVVVKRPEHIEALVRRGIRLARQRGGRCRVLLLREQGVAADELTERAEAAATAGGATVLLRETRDPGAAIVAAVQELNVRHLVLAAHPPGLLDRWRGTLPERLASQLTALHLYIETAPGPERPGEQGSAPLAADGAAAPRHRGTVRVYLGYAPGCGTTTAMLEEAGRRRSRGGDVVVGAVDARDREGVLAELEGLELVGDGRALDTAAVLARRPEVVCIDDLTAGTTTAESRFAAARRLAEAGITVVGTVQLGRLGVAPAGQPVLLDEAGLLALADEIELVDVPPSILTDRVRRGEIVPGDQVPQALATTYAPDVLRAARERAFALVAEHGERRLAAYAGELATGLEDAPGQDRQPSILACAAPRPGMEALIRRAAAQAAGVDGVFRVAVVRTSQPDAREDGVVGEYGTLTEQLGGEFVVLTAASSASTAAALAEFAARNKVTQLVLARAKPNPAGRYPVLRELVRQARDVELQVLPVEEAD